jgi:glutamate-1-semialdehyde 2,1-aminomutase
MIRKEPDLAAVILEPVSHAVVKPDLEFLKALREVTQDKGILLIFDEVVTGFRLAPGGAQEYFHVTPDMATLGKIAGGGFPFGAVVGKADVMQTVSPLKPPNERVDVFGTYSGNPVSMIAGLTTLELLQDGAHQRYANELGERLSKGISKSIADHSIQAQVTNVGSLLNIHFDISEPVTSPRIAWKADAQKRIDFQLEMINNGVFMKPGGGYFRVSASHTDQDVESTLEKAETILSTYI